MEMVTRMCYPPFSTCRVLANVLALDYFTSDVAPVRCRNWRARVQTRVDSANPGESMKRQLTGALRRSILLVAAVRAASLVAVGPAQAITNGQPDGNQHPNVGLMVVIFGSGPEPFCTGTLIAPTRFLTAAHCIAFLQQLGGETIGVTFDPRTFDPSRPVIPAVKTEVDPAFGHDQGDFHDLAVITLESPAPATPAVLPAAGLLDQLAAHG